MAVIVRAWACENKRKKQPELIYIWALYELCAVWVGPVTAEHFVSVNQLFERGGGLVLSNLSAMGQLETSVKSTRKRQSDLPARSTSALIDVNSTDERVLRRYWISA